MPSLYLLMPSQSQETTLLDQNSFKNEVITGPPSVLRHTARNCQSRASGRSQI